MASIHSASTVLPVELVELIMTEFWAQSLSSRDRATFMKSSVGVSRSWASMYMRLFCRDIHIPSGGFALKFLQIIRHESPLYDYFTWGGSLLSQQCQSISFQSDSDKIVQTSLAPTLPSSNHVVDLASESPMGVAIYAILRALYFTPFLLPNLRRISIQFSNSTMRDLFARNKFIGFPSQVTELEIDFVYDDRTPTEVLEEISENEEFIGLVPGSMKNVRKVHAVGLTKGAMDELMAACSNWEDLETEAWRCGQQEEEDHGENQVEDEEKGTAEEEFESDDAHHEHSESEGDASEYSESERDDVAIPTTHAPSPITSVSKPPSKRQRFASFRILSSALFSFATIGL